MNKSEAPAMKKQTSTILMTLLCAAAASVGCSTASVSNDAGTGGAGGGGTGSGGTTNFTTVPLTPDATGFVALDTTGDTGVQGPWYAYGDSLGMNGMPPGDCQGAGHTDAECSTIVAPAAGTGFVNMDGKMCTSGTVAKVIDKVGMAGMPDYAKIWGAGIALDLNNPGGAAVKSAIDATAKGIKGIQFDIDTIPLAKLRVEVEATDTNGTEAGNDYWGANSTYPPSPVVVGTNTVTWDKFVGPKGHKLDPAMLRGIQFHVPANTSSTGAYQFCISNLKLLK